eukprot:TRINITY_DN53670_c0_g1_i1.p1 TRINITY_DN53670_c0_g1~~TRINITY_DN53670_c0_g1_i1.p1  ORF type:complete len:230 (+),score=62.34 TRINITY_DN53670_c0_g1_i1:419-1108(+)
MGSGGKGRHRYEPYGPSKGYRKGKGKGKGKHYPDRYQGPRDDNSLGGVLQTALNKALTNTLENAVMEGVAFISDHLSGRSAAPPVQHAEPTARAGSSLARSIMGFFTAPAVTTPPPTSGPSMTRGSDDQSSESSVGAGAQQASFDPMVHELLMTQAKALAAAAEALQSKQATAPEPENEGLAGNDKDVVVLEPPGAKKTTTTQNKKSTPKVAAGQTKLCFIAAPRDATH